MKIFHLPDLGEGLPDAEIHHWYVKPGDTVKTDDLLVSMETAKAVVDVPSPRNGTIVKLYGSPGDIIKTNAPLVEFSEGDAAPINAVGSNTVAGSLEVSDVVIEQPAAGITPTKNTASIKAIPAVRMLAKELGIDLQHIIPTGSQGQITLEDVKRAKAELDETINMAHPNALRGIRRSMAISMGRSHAEVVPVTIVDDADIHAWNANTDITVRIIQAIVNACQAEPALNAHFEGKNLVLELKKEVHVGLALDSGDGLFVPVIKHAEQASNAQLREKINQFKQQVTARTIAPADMQGATIMLSNFGIFAGRYANPVVVPPCVAILGIGRHRLEVVSSDSQIAIHKILPLSLTFDHRAVTGGEASRFLGTLIAELQKSD